MSSDDALRSLSPLRTDDAYGAQMCVGAFARSIAAGRLDLFHSSKTWVPTEFMEQAMQEAVGKDVCHAHLVDVHAEFAVELQFGPGSG